MTLSAIFLSEFIGTAILITLGVGVCATNLLTKSKGRATGWLMINFGWGLAVYAGVYFAWSTGGHLNPAVTLGMIAAGKTEFASGVPITFTTTVIYILAQLSGAILGAILAWLMYREQYQAHDNKAEILGTFATGPEIRKPFWNCITEIIATFILVAWVLISGYTQNVTVGPLAVALIVVAIGASCGGPTGYAINPARDLGPRIAHAILPIQGKGKSDWGYSWVPIAGPIIGGILAGLLFGPGTLQLLAI